MSLLLVDGSVAADSPPVPASLVFRRNPERYPAGGAFSIESTFTQLADPLPYQFVARLNDQIRFNPKQSYYTQPRFDPITCVGPLSAGAGADDAGFGVVPWINPGNIATSDNTYAVASIGTFGGATPSHYLVSSSHGFAIPSDAVVVGITLEIERKDASASGTITDSRVRIVKGGVIGSTDKASATVWPNTDAYQTYGSSTDMWGLPWTPSDINANNFGGALSAGSSSSPPVDASVDHFRITVCYTGGTVSADGRTLVVYSQTRDSRPVPIAQAYAIKSLEEIAVVPGNLLPNPYVAREINRPIQQGKVTAIKTDGPDEEHVGFPHPVIARQAEKPGFGGSYYLWATKLLTPILAGDSRQVAIIARQGERPLPMGSIQFLRTDGPIPESVGLPRIVVAKEPQRPGDGGKTVRIGTKYPGENAPRPSIVSNRPEKPRDGGKVTAISTAPPSSISLPNGKTLVFRDLSRVPASGSTLILRPTATDIADPRPIPARIQSEIPPALIAGRSKSIGSMPEPRPEPPISYVSRQPERVYLPGSVLFVHSTALAQPPGALVPRPMIARQSERPGFGGLILISKADQDYFLPPGCPLFVDVADNPFVDVAPENYNSDSPRDFRARNRCL